MVKYILSVFISIAMLLISSPVKAAGSADDEGVNKIGPPGITSQTVSTTVGKKSPTKASEAAVEIPRNKLIAPAGTVHREVTIRPTPGLIKMNNFRQGCLAGDLQMGEALKIFQEYYNESEYSEHHKIYGIRITRDHETHETVYQVDLCPLVIYNDNAGNESEASFFVDMSGEIFITERQINKVQ